MKKLSIMAVSILFLYGCDMAYLYNYGGMKTVAELQKEEEAWLAKKTPLERKLYKKNVDICYDKAKKMQKHGGKKHFNIYFDNCMKERGSPMP